MAENVYSVYVMIKVETIDVSTCVKSNEYISPNKYLIKLNVAFYSWVITFTYTIF